MTVHIVKFSLWGKTIKRMLVICPKAVDDHSERLGGLFWIYFGMIIWGTPWGTPSLSPFHFYPSDRSLSHRHYFPHFSSDPPLLNSSCTRPLRKCSAQDNASAHENAQRKTKDDRARIRSVDSKLEVQHATTVPKD